MSALFRLEILNFWRIGLIVSILHFLILSFLNFVDADITHAPLSQYWKMLAMIGGASFAAIQMSSHKRRNKWIYLLHRPIHHKKILISLVLAALCLLILMIVIPYFLVLIVMDFEGDMGIEYRHYAELPFAATTVFSAYMVAGFAILNPHRLALLAAIPLMSYVSNFIDSRLWLSVPLLLTGYFLALLHSFRYDINKPSTKARELLTFELPIQFGLFLLISMVSFLSYSLVWNLTSTSPFNNPKPGTHLHTFQQPPQQRMLMVLHGSDHPDSAIIRQQIEIGEIVDIDWTPGSSFPKRHQRPSLDNNLLLSDDERNADWRFSHTEMLYKGTERETRQALGWLSPSGFSTLKPDNDDRFSTIPWVTNNQFIVNNQFIFQVDWTSRNILQRFSLADKPFYTPDERFSDSLTITENVTTLLSNSHFYIFRSDEFMDIDSVLRARTRILTPPQSLRTMRTNVVELIDGYLVLFMAQLPNIITPVEPFSSFNRGGYSLYRTDELFNNELIAQKIPDATFNSVFIYGGLVAAPGMRLLVDFGLGMYLGRDLERTLPLLFFDFPAIVLVLASLVSICSALLTHLLLLRTDLPRNVRRFWVVMNCFSGCLGLLSMLGLYWRRVDFNRQSLTSDRPEMPKTAHRDAQGAGI